ncbi:DUF6531 domain-containing protein [Streptomyces sp. NPDC050161]|uniref:DUF6531 domain-containing protein n=1 Tax=Streptomyces sp. NPDC050161 TaxID=3365604 RepID=UPI0037A6A698
MTSPIGSPITRPVRELLGRQPGYGFASDGVSTATGNYTQHVTDLTFPESLLGLLDFTRTYNSLGTYSPPPRAAAGRPRSAPAGPGGGSQPERRRQLDPAQRQRHPVTVRPGRHGGHRQLLRRRTPGGAPGAPGGQQDGLHVRHRDDRHHRTLRRP